MATEVDLKNGIIRLSVVNDEYDQTVFPAMFRLTGATAVGHTAQVTTMDGKPVANLEAGGASVADVIIRVRKHSKMNGLKLTQINSGTVEIYLY